MSDRLQILIDQDRLARRVSELAKQISEDYRGRCPILVAVLKGGFVFMADLIRELDIEFVVDFIAIGSYGGNRNSSGAVKLLKDLNHDISGEDVIFIEDIVDSGLSLSYIYANFLARQPKSIEVVTLLDKIENRKADLRIKYVGFEIPDRFVIGYGLDLDERFRGLPYIACLTED
ncbi:MAG: hypoxanthine phosphoribosyltransferase [candidate division Zixibacteria bacterium]|nr:hypoxanthine phosphoribosyltransferase [candidate division Zixibacteria bacterium]MBU1470493.1 hypoxanthine phosphoribosyltransferase [candidate division Zixibacteria bacterium]